MKAHRLDDEKCWCKPQPLNFNGVPVLAHTDKEGTTYRELRSNQMSREDAWVMIGKRLKAARIAKKLSQATVANALGLSPNMIYKYESGDSGPGLGTLTGLRDILGLDLNKVLEGVSFRTKD